MSRNKDAHAARRAELNALGKDLSRRARSKCELCGTGDGARPCEIPPVEDPDLATTILACDRCQEIVAAGPRAADADDLRFLETAIWSEIPPVQVAAVRLLRQLAAADVAWAAEADDGLWLPDELAERI